MANSKISALPVAVTPLAGTETLPVVQSGVTKQVSVANLTAGRAVSAASYSATGNALFYGASALAGTAEIGLGTNSVATAFVNVNSSGNSQYRLYTSGTYRGGLFSTGSGATVASNGQLNFSVDSGGNNAAYLDTSGSISNFQLANGSFVARTAGKGLDLSANTPAAGMTSQLLNWYEEGTWTPSLGGSATYTAQLGRYTRVGRAVTINGYIKVNVLGSGSAYLITGLPFTSANDGIGASVSFSIWKNLATTPVFLSGYIYPNFAGIEIQGITAGSANTGALSVLQNTSEIYFSGTYFV